MPHWLSTDRRSARMHCCGSAASSAASSSARWRASPLGTTRLASPIAYASSASTPRPVRIMSIARLCPISRGSRTVPPSISGTPQRRQNTPMIASSSTTRMSHHSASSRPPATAYPLTAAITGLDSTIRLGPIGPGPVRCTGLASGVPNALRSAPAQKVPLSPHSTATAAESSLSNSSNAAYSPAAAGPFTALRASGRFMITVVTGPFCSTRTPRSVMSPPSVRHRHAAQPVRRRSRCRPHAVPRPASRQAAVRRAAPDR